MITCVMPRRSLIAAVCFRIAAVIAVAAVAWG
jgi:hypothetical protein